MRQASARGYGVTAVLGPTNTGKTHLAIERMIAHKSGLIGLPLRLLAREVYTRLCEKLGQSKVSLVTGEERIVPENSSFQVCTVEAMPEDTDADFVAIDEIQLAASLDRGHFFTDRLLNLRGQQETMILGADTMAGVLRDLLPGVKIVSRPRMSVLSYSGSKKITRMPNRTAIVAFSADEVYAIAELVKRERGGAAVVTGSLSPRTRNAQVAHYQAGDVDFLIATDAIGMGLNLDVDHVAFAQDSKFDGFQHRRLTAAELAQVAGRAGRYKRDGTFGITSRVQPFPDELVEALETHQFQPVKILSWRNRDLDYSSLDRLKNTLDQGAPHARLMKSPPGTDLVALETLGRDPDIADIASNHEMVKLLWEVSKTPDYRKISPAMHAELLARVYTDIARHEFVGEDWFAKLVDRADDTGGQIDALSARIASVRTCTYISNRDNWLENPQEWREKTREVEDRLSDALHEMLTKRFIDRRTSLLMKRLKENRMLEAEIEGDGTVKVEGHQVGSIQGFRFSPDASAGGKEAKALNAAATKSLAAEIERRAERLAACPNSDVVLASDGTLRWIGQPVARISKGEAALKPRILMLADEHLTGSHLDMAVARLERWVANHINTLLKPLSDLRDNSELNGIARGIAFRLVENLGTLQRREVLEDVKNLDQDMRGSMRRNGVRFGAYHIFVPSLLKPAPTRLICLLWAVFNEKTDAAGLTEIPDMSAAGRTSFQMDPAMQTEFYGLAGFMVLGDKAVRIDILERLADLIRPATGWNADSGQPRPDGAVDGRSFFVTPGMMSILGATHEDMEVILKGLGYKGTPRLAEEVRPPAQMPDQVPGEAADAEAGNVEEAQPGDSEPATDAEDTGPAMITVWQFGGRSERGRNRKPAHSKGKQARSKNRNDKSHQNDRQRKPKTERGPDPDSPFAALAGLKKQLDSGNEQG